MNSTGLRKAGQRVYLEQQHAVTGETRRIYGTVTSDDIDGWDYTSVVFDDAPGMVQAVLCYYLHDHQENGA